MQLQKIRMTLTGALKGQTIVLRKRKFVDGVYESMIPANDEVGLRKYFTTSYQVRFENLTNQPKEAVKEEAEVEEVKEEAEVEEVEEKVKDNVAIRVDDSDVMSDEEIEDKEDDVATPNNRQQAIIAAVNQIEKEKWIEQDTNPHPKVADVASIMDDPTVSKEEIVEVIETWLS